MDKLIPVDVIIPTYNRSATLARAIESVLNQTHKNFTLHIVDDGSSDETDVILKTYTKHPQIKIFKQENAGVSSARNLGAKNATSEWMCFLDSDDEWLPKKLETQLQYIGSHPHCSFIHSEEIWIRNGVRVNPKKKHDKSSENIFERSLEFCLISPSTVMMKRSLFFEHHGFNEEFLVCEDYDLWLRILLKENIGYIESPLIQKYGGHPDQLSTKFVAMDYWRIKSLVSLFKNPSLKEWQQEKIKEVLIKKSEILLKSYLKYQNQKHFDEINSELNSIMLSVKI